MKSRTIIRTLMSAIACFSLALSVGCDSNSSKIDEEDEELEVSSSSEMDSHKSSSSSAPELSDVLTDVEQGSLNESATLASPSDVSLARLAPSVFQLSWNYEESKNLTGFVIQRLAPTSLEWEDLGALAPTVSHLVIDGDNNINYYYRLAAYYGETRSKYTKEILISNSVSYESGLGFPVAPSVIANIDRDSTLEFVLTGNYPSQAVQYSIYNYDSTGKKVGDVYYEARFVYGYNYSVDTVQFKLDQSIVSKQFKKLEDLCNSFGQIRAVWQDKNGSLDYSDWTSPIGTKTGTTEGLKGDIATRCADIVAVDAKFPIPTDLKAESVANTWLLEWNYKEADEHPVVGFVIQKLDLDKSSWKDIGQTGPGIYRFKIGILEEEYSYYRVAAVDSAKVRSGFTGDVVITVSPSKVALGKPSIVGVNEYSATELSLSWNFTDNEDRPATGFYVQELNVVTNKWATITGGSVGPTVYKFLIEKSSKIRYFRIAAYDDNGMSYSEDYTVEVYETSGAEPLATPSKPAFAITNDGKYELTWSYSNNAKHSAVKLVVESNATGAVGGNWTEVAIVDVSVSNYVMAAPTGAAYYHVVAVDEGGERAMSGAVYISVNEDGAEPLATPSKPAFAIGKDGKYELTWSYSNNAKHSAVKLVVESNATGAVGGNWTEVATVDVSVSNYMMATPTEAAYYHVVAVDEDGERAMSDAIYIPAYTVDLLLMNPSNVRAVRLAPSVWALEWDYDFDPTKNREATGFRVLHSVISTGSWESEELSSTKTKYKVLKATSTDPILERYYGVVSYDDEGESEVSNIIQITEAVPFREDLAFEPPQLNIKTISTFMQVGEEMVLDAADVFVAVMENQVTKNILHSEYTKSVEYEIRKITGGTTDSPTNASDTYTLQYRGNGEAALTMKYVGGKMKVCLDSYNDYFQVRVKWTDENDVVAYSEWSSLHRVGDSVSGCD